MTRDELIALANKWGVGGVTVAGLEGFAAALSARPKEAAPSEELAKALKWIVDSGHFARRSSIVTIARDALAATKAEEKK